MSPCGCFGERREVIAVHFSLERALTIQLVAVKGRKVFLRQPFGNHDSTKVLGGRSMQLGYRWPRTHGRCR